ncbi:MAG: flavodoxin family protein [Candidatus Lokiarchaeota archaeon]|nr:flavodoxin family protein [Candidatus Lokiarchaeota archaeon]
MLKAIIIYHTRTGNTKSLAEKIKKRLEYLNIVVEVYQDNNFKALDSLNDFDIISLGSPTHYWQIASDFKEFLKKINGFNLKGKKLIVFATGVSPKSHPKICSDIIKIMKPSGIDTIAKIGCVKEPTDDLDTKIEQVISKDLFQI